MEFHLVIALQSLHNSPDLNILIPPRRETVSIQIVRRPRAVVSEFKKKHAYALVEVMFIRVRDVRIRKSF